MVALLPVSYLHRERHGPPDTDSKDWTPMKIALLGYGTVGRGVDQIIAERVEGVEVTRILELPDRLSDPRMTASYDDILADETIELVVECMGGVEPARTYIMGALESGRHVVTSNKAVVAAHFDEFAAASVASGAGLFVEAAVGGGVPWIAGIEKARRVDEVTSFSGIMNGTTNYIVDAMRRQGAEFDVVLAEAQRLGYAERDPSADIDGIDVLNKTIISASVAFGVACEKNLPASGIRNLTKADLELFAAHGRTVKLLGRGVSADGRYAAAVEPVAVPADSLEANVPGNFNLLTLDATTARETTDRGLRDTLDVLTHDLTMPLGTTLTETFTTLASARHGNEVTEMAPEFERTCVFKKQGSKRVWRAKWAAQQQRSPRFHTR